MRYFLILLGLLPLSRTAQMLVNFASTPRGFFVDRLAVAYRHALDYGQSRIRVLLDVALILVQLDEALQRSLYKRGNELRTCFLGASSLSDALRKPRGSFLTKDEDRKEWELMQLTRSDCVSKVIINFFLFPTGWYFVLVDWWKVNQVAREPSRKSLTRI